MIPGKVLKMILELNNLVERYHTSKVHYQHYYNLRQCGITHQLVIFIDSHKCREHSENTAIFVTLLELICWLLRVPFAPIDYSIHKKFE